MGIADINYRFVSFSKLLQMTRYKQADFADEDTSSIGSRSLNETTTIPTMHIRYHTAQVNSQREMRLKLSLVQFVLIFLLYLQSMTLWRTRTKLEKYLIVALSVLTVIFAILLLSITSSGDAKDTSHATSKHTPIDGKWAALLYHCNK